MKKLITGLFILLTFSTLGQGLRVKPKRTKLHSEFSIPCIGIEGNQIFLDLVILPPQIEVSCLPYSDTTHLSTYFTDNADQHRLKQIDQVTGNIFESNWQPGVDTVISPIVMHNLTKIWVNTIHGTDTCGYTGPFGFSAESFTPPFNCFKRNLNLSIYPNPIKQGEVLTFSYTSDKDQVLQGYLHINSLGSKEINLPIQVKKGTNEFYIPCNSKGLYFLTLSVDNKTVNQTVVVQ